MAGDTRNRIVQATGDLFQRQGYTGTGLKQIAEQASAPFGSIYHFFPGGKGELAAEVLRTTGEAFGSQVMAVFDACPDLETAVRVSFGHAAQALLDSGFADVCPIETVALEVASTDERLRLVTAEVFTDWIDRSCEHLPARELPEEQRRAFVLGYIAVLEGAFVLCRALRSIEPMTAAGRMALAAARAELAAVPRGE